MMTRDNYRYSLARHIPLADVETTLVLALMATESLHGEAQVRLDAVHGWDRARRTCTIDAGTLVGRDLNRLFVGFIRREFGVDAFTVERVDAFANHQCQEQTI